MSLENFHWLAKGRDCAKVSISTNVTKDTTIPKIATNLASDSYKHRSRDFSMVFVVSQPLWIVMMCMCQATGW